jgi:hypothetical protein
MNNFKKNVSVSKHNIQKRYLPRDTEKISTLSSPSMAGPGLTASDYAPLVSLKEVRLPDRSNQAKG